MVDKHNTPLKFAVATEEIRPYLHVINTDLNTASHQRFQLVFIETSAHFLFGLQITNLHITTPAEKEGEKQADRILININAD